MRVLTDDDVARFATPDLVREAMRSALLAAWRGELIAPPRAYAEVGGGRLTFTCGRRPGDWVGFRSYLAPGDHGDEQIVAVQDDTSGVVRGIAVGRALGPRRVGGMSAVAAELLAPATVDKIALVGAGQQAWHQLWALPPRFRRMPVALFSRTPATAETFADRARRELGFSVELAGSAREATVDAGLVVLATSSATPVITGADIRPGALVITVGPKQIGRAEFGPEIAEQAALVVSDSPAQMCAYDPPNVLAGTPAAARLRHLGAIIAGDEPVVPGTRVYFSVGLAGTEVWLLNAVLAASELS